MRNILVTDMRYIFVNFLTKKSNFKYKIIYFPFFWHFSFVPKDMADEVFVSKICVKDHFLKSGTNNDATFSVIKSRTSARYVGSLNFKK